jgi:hypothetical protein
VSITIVDHIGMGTPSTGPICAKATLLVRACAPRRMSTIHEANHKVDGTTSGEMLAQTRDLIEYLFRQRRVGLLKVGDETATNIFDLLQT